MKCPKCHFEVPEGSNFCNKCGYPFNSGEPPLNVNLSEPHSYTPKFLADKILTTRSALEGERKRVTVLFADVANYTSMAEKLDPEQVHQVMDGCFKILIDEIHRFEGTINQFTGDGIMALFGAPLAIENHAQNACRAALSIQTVLQRYSEDLKSKNGFEFRMRIGINSGPVIVGSIGDDLRMDYTAIGDTTNLAARMEGMAEPGNILASPNTYKRVEQQFEFKSLGKTELKGKEDAIEVYELVKEKIDRPRLGIERQIFSAMVGRDKELNQLELQITKAINGEGSVVNLIGEAGIGKSRLIDELKKRDVIKGVKLLEGRAISIGRNLSFHPMISLLKNWAGIREEDNSSTIYNKLETAVINVCEDDANEVFPFLATLIGMKLTGRHAERIRGIEGEALEKLIYKNVRELLIKTAEFRPLSIVIEDLHWADASTVELLEALFRLSETHRMVFINVFRPNHPETSEHILETLNNKLSVYHLEIYLQPLTEKMSETLINNMLKIRGLPYALIDQIVTRSGGNPFFIEEVVRSFVDEGAVVRTNGEFKTTPKIEKMVIPQTINDVLMARIDRLDENNRELLKTASVIGRNFFYRILTEVAKNIEDLDAKLSYLKEIELIRERRRMEELEYLFKHALAQEAAYESILQQKRKYLHLQVASSIEKVFDERIHEFYGMLSLHYIRGENYEKAEEYLIKAGEEALRSSASSEALNYYQEGLKLYLQANKDRADPEKLAMFEKNIAIALYNKCRWEEGVEHIDKVFEYCNIKANPSKSIILLAFFINITLIFASLDKIIKKKKPVPNQSEKEVLELIYKKSGAFVYFDNLLMFFSGLDGFNRAVKFNITESKEALNFYTALSGIMSFGGVSFKISDKILSISKTQIDKKDINNLMAYTCMKEILNFTAGYWRENSILEVQLLNNSFEKGIMWESTTYIMYFSWLKIGKGEFSECETCISMLFEIENTYDYAAAALYGYFLSTLLAIAKGNFKAAKKSAEQGIAFCLKHDLNLHQLQFWSWKAEAQILSGQIENNEECLSQAKAILDQQNLPAPGYAEVYLVARFLKDIYSLKRSVEVSTKIDPELEKKAWKSGKASLKVLKRYKPYRPKVYRLMGEYFWLTGRQKKALKWWDKSIKFGESMSAKPDLSRTYFEVGKRLLEPNSKYKKLNGITAEEYLKKARTMFEEMDLQWDLDELDKLMASN